MSGIRYDFDSDASSLVRAAGQAAEAMARAEQQAAGLTASLGKMGESSDRSAKEVQRAAIESEKAVKRFEQEYLRSLEAQEKAERKAAREAQRVAIEKEKAVKRFEREYLKSLAEREKAERKAAEEAEKARRAQSNSFSDIARNLNSSPIISNVEAIGSVFIQLGGVISQLAILFTSLVRPLAVVGTMLGPAAPIALGLAAIPAAALAAASATKAVINKLVELGQTAVEVQDDVKGIVPPKVSHDLLVIEQGLDALDMQGKLFSATLASDLGPAINGAINLLLGIGVMADDARKALDYLAERVDTSSTAFRIFHAIASLGSSELARALAEVGERARKDIDGSLAPYLGKWKEIETQAAESVDTFENAMKRLEQADKDAKKAAEEHAKAQEGLAEAITWATEDLLTAEGKIQAAANERIGKLYELQLTEEEISLGILAIKQREAREINALYDERVKSAFKSLEKEKLDAEAFARDTQRVIADMEADTRDFLVEQAETLDKELEKTRANMESALFDLAHSAEEAFGLIGESIVGKFEAVRDEYTAMVDESESRIADLEQKVEESEGRNRARAKQALAEEKARQEMLANNEHTAAVAAFKQQQQFAVSQAIMAGALAIIQAYAQLGPVAGSVAAVGVGAVTSMQLAIIQDQDPPARRHDGGDLGPDEFVFRNRTVRNNEGAVVLNQRAVESGALERVARMNRDMDDGASREVRLVLADAGRVIGEAVVSESMRPGSRLRGAVGSKNYGQRDPYGRGRR